MGTRAQTEETTQETYLKTKMKASLLTKTRFSGARLAIKAASRRSASVRMGARAEVGLFYSTSTGNTEAAADWIKQKFSGDITDPTDIGEVDVSDLEGYSSLIVGAPTWNTGAVEGRSGTVSPPGASRSPVRAWPKHGHRARARILEQAGANGIGFLSS